MPYHWGSWFVGWLAGYRSMPLLQMPLLQMPLLQMPLLQMPYHWGSWFVGWWAGYRCLCWCRWRGPSQLRSPCELHRSPWTCAPCNAGTRQTLQHIAHSLRENAVLSQTCLRTHLRGWKFTFLGGRPEDHQPWKFSGPAKFFVFRTYLTIDAFVKIKHSRRNLPVLVLVQVW